jgi:hypothetical protein
MTRDAKGLELGCVFESSAAFPSLEKLASFSYAPFTVLCKRGPRKSNERGTAPFIAEFGESHV